VLLSISKTPCHIGWVESIGKGWGPQDDGNGKELCCMLVLLWHVKQGQCCPKLQIHKFSVSVLISFRAEPKSTEIH